MDRPEGPTLRFFNAEENNLTCDFVIQFAAKTARAEVGMEATTLIPEKMELLRDVFWDMCTLSAQMVELPAIGRPVYYEK